MAKTTPRIGLVAIVATLSLQALPAVADSVDPVALKRFVHQDCGSCHGLTLKGGLGPDLTYESMQFYDRDLLISVVLDGIEDTPMPPWRALLNDDEAAWIADYLLSGDSK